MKEIKEIIEKKKEIKKMITELNEEQIDMVLDELKKIVDAHTNPSTSL